MKTGSVNLGMYEVSRIGELGQKKSKRFIIASASAESRRNLDDEKRIIV